jgi:hypothetical protein
MQPDIPFDAEDIPYFFDNWCSLPWSPWIPFSADKREFGQIPHEPGLYRIRPVGRDFLMYIGETRRPLHQRLSDLRMELRNREIMPWIEPHAEAPGLWAWRDAEGFAYECSATPLDASTGGRKGMESFLLYHYRQERGESPLCNLGRFHPRYRRSSDHKTGLRGGKLEAGQLGNPAGEMSLPPRNPTGDPGSPEWMGIQWSISIPLVPERAGDTPAGPGVYLLADDGTREILTLGQAGNCAERFLSLCRRSWERREPVFSFFAMEGTVLPHQLRELENDLLGNFFERFRKSPEYQFPRSR